MIQTSVVLLESWAVINMFTFDTALIVIVITLLAIIIFFPVAIFWGAWKISKRFPNVYTKFFIWAAAILAVCYVTIKLFKFLNSPMGGDPL